MSQNCHIYCIRGGATASRFAQYAARCGAYRAIALNTRRFLYYYDRSNACEEAVSLLKIT